MPTKEELSDRLNEILGLEDEVDFSKMTKEDLESLLKVIGEPSNLIRIGWKNARDKVKREILEEILGRPFLDEILKGIPAKEGEQEDKGPLGFGVIPRAKARIREIFTEKEAKE